jgi:hypothetical protein
MYGVDTDLPNDEFYRNFKARLIGNMGTQTSLFPYSSWNDHRRDGVHGGFFSTAGL